MKKLINAISKEEYEGFSGVFGVNYEIFPKERLYVNKDGEYFVRSDITGKYISVKETLVSLDGEYGTEEEFHSEDYRWLVYQNVYASPDNDFVMFYDTDEVETLKYAKECGFFCSDCGHWFISESGYETHDGYRVCEQCRDDSYYYCTCCGELFFEDVLDGDLLCDDCRRRECVPGYHEYERGFRFMSLNSDKSGPLHNNDYLGLELELSNIGGDNTDFIKEVKNKFPFQFCYDGSVNDGYEGVSDACTFLYWKQKIDLDGFIDKALDHGFDPDYSAGIHIHLSRHNFTEEAEEKLCRFVYNNYDTLVKFGRRDPSELDYCSRPNFRDQNIRYNCEYHSCAINLTHSETIEFRFFATSDDTEHIYAILEFVDAIKQAAFNEKIRIITWDILKDICRKDNLHDNLLKEIEEGFENKITKEYNYSSLI